MALGYTSYTQELIGEHLDLACNEAERADREFDILQDYPAYYDDENVYEQRDKWLADFISQVSPNPNVHQSIPVYKKYSPEP